MISTICGKFIYWTITHHIKKLFRIWMWWNKRTRKCKGSNCQLVQTGSVYHIKVSARALDSLTVNPFPSGVCTISCAVLLLVVEPLGWQHLGPVKQQTCLQRRQGGKLTPLNFAKKFMGTFLCNLNVKMTWTHLDFLFRSLLNSFSRKKGWMWK